MWRQLHPAVQSERSLRLPSPSCPQGGTCRHRRADGSRAIRGSLCGRPQSETRWKAAPHLLSAGDAVVRALRESLSLLTRNEPSAEPCGDLSPKWQGSSALAFTSSLASSSANFASRLALRKSWYAPKLQILGRPGLFCRPHRAKYPRISEALKLERRRSDPALPADSRKKGLFHHEPSPCRGSEPVGTGTAGFFSSTDRAPSRKSAWTRSGGVEGPPSCGLPDAVCKPSSAQYCTLRADCPKICQCSRPRPPVKEKASPFRPNRAVGGAVGSAAPWLE